MKLIEFLKLKTKTYIGKRMPLKRMLLKRVYKKTETEINECNKREEQYALVKVFFDKMHVYSTEKQWDEVEQVLEKIKRLPEWEQDHMYRLLFIDIELML